MEYIVKKAPVSFDFTREWNEVGYDYAETLVLTNFMGEKPAHFPKVQAKVLYDNANMYVFFKVEDQYVKAIYNNLHDPVCKDSCAEFFFTPGEDTSRGYFNIEINCGGTMLMHYQTAKGENTKKILEQHCKQIKIKSSMPRIVEPEITAPTAWTIQYSVPFEILKEYAKFSAPAGGDKWRANFYKCADKTSHPHWLTWSKVELPKPDFHRPEFFGTLVFD
ncbi:MAG: hypothetical protein BWY69_01224 [Planctomycetes bacterium ADurb.Bin401]|nr:MAG: hypothetical protein BWY69_01224 [Planctomycetes bacterium ADurb.Bin401]